MSWIDRSRPKSGVKSQKSLKTKKVERLDTVFSKFIRRRDCGFSYGRCISCGGLIQFNSSDAGHYINRSHMALRFEETNVHAQCRKCNRFDEGNVQGYRRGLITRIGEKATDMLEIRKHNICNLSEVELDLLHNIYKQKLAVLEAK